MEIYKNQTKNQSVLAKILKVYIICTPKCDAFGNSFFPLLSIMECYKPNRWRMFYFLYPPLHSTRIVFTSFGDLVNVLRDYRSIRVGSSFKEKQFVRMLHVINEVTIDTCDIHQIKENAVVKSNTWLSIRMICGRTLVHKINSTHAAFVKLDNLGQGTKDLVFEPFFLLWADNMPFIPSKADDKSSTDRFSIHMQTIVLPQKRNSQSPLFICLSSIIFGICFLLARTVPIP